MSHSSPIDETYEYYPLDNVRKSILGGSERRYVYSTGTQRLSQITNASSVVLNSYIWNDRGELDHRTVGGIGEDLTFDRARRMTLAPDGSTHRYDAHNRRVKTTIPGGTTRYQFYARNGQLLFVEDALAQDTYDYLHLGSTLVAHRKLNAADKLKIGVRHFYHSDHRGSPSAKTLTNGSVVERSRLKPYGDPYDGIWREGPGFTKHAMDEAGKLVYMQQRYFDPAMFGFISPDPVSATAESFNVYWYANGNPYTMVDPDGRWASMAQHPGIQQSVVFGLEPPGANQARIEVQKIRVRSAPIAQSPMGDSLTGRVRALMAKGDWDEAKALLELSNGRVSAAVLRAVEASTKLRQIGYGPNNVAHVFKAKHQMEPLVRLTGSQEVALLEIHGAAQALGTTANATGHIVPGVVSVLGQNVWVSGRVVDGIVRVGTASMRGIP